MIGAFQSCCKWLQGILSALTQGKKHQNTAYFPYNLLLRLQSKKIVLKQRKLLFNIISSFNIAKDWAKDTKLSWWSFKSRERENIDMCK